MPYTNIARDEEATCMCLADHVVMEIPNVGTFSGDFEGSLTVAPGVQIMQDERAMLPLAIRGHKTEGNIDRLGRVSVSHDGTRPAPLSHLRQNEPGNAFPATQEMYVNILVKIEKLEGITLRNVRPGVLLNPSLDSFPPRNAKYDLQAPMDLEDVDNPGPVLARIVSYTARINPE